VITASARTFSWVILPAVMALSFGAYGQQRSDVMVADAVEAYQIAMGSKQADERIEQFSKAHRLFAQVIEDGDIQNADLYTNLGNSALQAQRLGLAILAYRRALTIEPGHTQAAKNLAHARTLLPSWAPSPESDTLIDTFLFWTRMFSIPAQVMVSSLFFALASILFAAAIRWRLRWARNLAILPLAIWATMTVSVIVQSSSGGAAEMVVVADEAIGYSADSAGSLPRFSEPLPGGVEIQLIEERNGWAHVRLADGRDAWLRRAALQPVQ